MYTLLIFDWDGTLLDSQARIVASMQAAALEAGQQALSADAVRDIIGLGLPEAIRKLIPGIADGDLQKVREGYIHHFMDQNDTPMQFFAGAEQGLRALKAQGYRLAVATGKSRRGLDKVLRETGIADLFEITRCADETASKPDPLMLNEILSETGVAQAQALMIGDTEYDLEMAQNAKIDSVGVSYGVHSVERLLACHPQKIIHQFSELTNWLADNSFDCRTSKENV